MAPANSPERTRRGRGALLLLLAFTGGLCSLGLEISASRLLAPFFGSSTPIWGALIGLILLYLTVGYYAGGWAADRWPRAEVLYWVAAAAGGVTLLLPPLSRPILRFSQEAFVAFSRQGPGSFLAALVAVLLLFSAPVVLMGAISPFVIRLRVERVTEAGRAAGAVYAISTAGSILGAFLPAFWTIPTFGTRATIYGLGTCLLLVAVRGLLLEAGSRRAALGAAGLVPLLLWGLAGGPVRTPESGALVYESESDYGYIQVAQVGRRRDLYLNEGHAVHSTFDPDHVLSGGYWDYFLLAPLFAPRLPAPTAPRNALVIGLAGGTVARELIAAYPGIHVDGVEIDQRIIDVGRRYFAMRDPALNAVAADGRYYLDTANTDYDLIIVDAYRQPYIPFQLATREFFAACRRHLTSRGVLAVNVGRAVNDRRLVDAVTGTLGAVFVDVYEQDTARSLNTVVYAPQQTISPAVVADVFSAAGAAAVLEPGDLPAGEADPAVLRASVARAATEFDPPRLVRPHLPVYTDDLAPVEQLVDSMIRRVVRGGG